MALFLGLLFYLVSFRRGGVQIWLGSIQITALLLGFVIGLMPLGFVQDRESGQQSLLRLTGFGPVRVFAESVGGSLWAVFELWLYWVPVLLGVAVLYRAPFFRAVLVTLLPGCLLLLLASVWILAVSTNRTRSGAFLFSFVIAAILVLPLLLGSWLSGHLPAGLQEVFRAVWGVGDWNRINEVLRPPGSCLPYLRGLARIGILSGLLLSVAAAFFWRDWRRIESASFGGKRRFHRLSWLWGGPRRRPTDGCPYLARYASPEGWRFMRWAFAGLVLCLGVTAAVAWSWRALPVALMVWLALVDIVAHVAVSGGVAEDRRNGAFELLFTTPLRPSEVLNAGHQVGRDIVRQGLPPGGILALVFAVWTLWMAGTGLRAGVEGLPYVGFWALPVVYAAALYHLPFHLPASQAANTGEPFHAFALPQTPVFLPFVAGLLAWLLSVGSFNQRIGAVLLALMIVVVILVVRENVASEQPLSDEEFRTVAAAPLPTPEVIPKDTRNTRPWIPDGFRR